MDNKHQTEVNTVCGIRLTKRDSESNEEALDRLWEMLSELCKRAETHTDYEIYKWEERTI